MSLFGLKYGFVSNRVFRSTRLAPLSISAGGIFENAVAGFGRTMFPRCFWVPWVPVTYQPPHRSLMGLRSVVSIGNALPASPLVSGITDVNMRRGTNFGAAC